MADNGTILDRSTESRSSVFLLATGIVIGMLLAGLFIPLAIGDKVTTSSGTSVASGPGGESAGLAEDGEAAPDGVSGAPGATGSAGLAGESVPRLGAAGGSVSGGAAAGAGPGRAGRLSASDVGVRPDKITIGIFLLDVGNLAKVGIAVPGVDPEQQKEAWNVFISAMNDQGGILGRRIEAVYRAYDVLSQDDQRAACLEIADKKVFVSLDIGGIYGPAVLCIVEENKLPFLTLGSQGMPRDFFPRAQGRLFSLFPSGVRGFANLIWELHQPGRLEDQKIGIVGDDETDPGGGTVDTGAVDTFRQLGYTVTHRTTLSRDRGTAASQIPVEVNQMQAKGVTTVLLLTGNLYATQFVQNADSRGYRPKYYATDWGSAYSDTWAANMPRSFEGTLAITTSRNGEFRVNAPEPALDRQCREQFEKATNKKLDRSGLPYNTTLRICSLFALFSDAATRAGADLTRPAYSEALQRLGPVGLATFGGGSFAPGKFDAADLVRTLRWEFGCKCWKPIDEFRRGRF